MLTGVVLLFFTALQVGVAWINYKSSTPLTDYARRNTEAAERFSASADRIRDGVALSASDLQRLAGATETGNASRDDADRPWIGLKLAATQFEVGKPITATFRFINSGRRPARIIQSRLKMLAVRKFPDNPEKYLGLADGSIGILVPGEVNYIPSSSQTINLTPEIMKALVSGKIKWFIYAEVVYTDIGDPSAKVRRTRACAQYYPEAASLLQNGFGDCSVYSFAS